MVLRMYETRLKESHPGSKTITYDLASLNTFIDELVRPCGKGSLEHRAAWRN